MVYGKEGSKREESDLPFLEIGALSCNTTPYTEPKNLLTMGHREVEAQKEHCCYQRCGQRQDK